MKKAVKIVALLVLVSMVFAGCAKMPLWFIKYDEDWIIGKTKEQIEAKYGEFDSYYRRVKYVDGVPTGEYVNVGRYVLQEEKVGYLGTDPAVFFIIDFNEAGIADNCYEETQAGG